MTEDLGDPASPSGSHAPHEAADASSPSVSIPIATHWRKRPIVVEAVKITAADFNGRDFDGSPFSSVPPWLVHAVTTGTVAIHPSNTDYAMWRIGTLEDGPNGEAKHIAGPGDWIVRGIKGELYPVKADIFLATYEPIPAQGIEAEGGDAVGGSVHESPVAVGDAP